MKNYLFLFLFFLSLNSSYANTSIKSSFEIKTQINTLVKAIVTDDFGNATAVLLKPLSDGDYLVIWPEGTNSDILVIWPGGTNSDRLVIWPGGTNSDR